MNIVNAEILKHFIAAEKSEINSFCNEHTIKV